MGNRYFQNKVVVITGSSRGIGRSTALELARRGAVVVLNGRNGERLEKTRRVAQSGQQFLLRLLKAAVDSFHNIAPGLPHLLGRHQQAGVIAGLEQVVQSPILLGHLLALLSGRFQPESHAEGFITGHVQVAQPELVIFAQVFELSYRTGHLWI